VNENASLRAVEANLRTQVIRLAQLPGSAADQKSVPVSPHSGAISPSANQK
jgi:hypothetical protein